MCLAFQKQTPHLSVHEDRVLGHKGTDIFARTTYSWFLRSFSVLGGSSRVILDPVENLF
jgi:hypothetical protein